MGKTKHDRRSRGGDVSGTGPGLRHDPLAVDIEGNRHVKHAKKKGDKSMRGISGGGDDDELNPIPRRLETKMVEEALHQQREERWSELPVSHHQFPRGNDSEDSDSEEELLEEDEMLEEDEELEEQDEEAFAIFSKPSVLGDEKRTIGDIIAAKLAEKADLIQKDEKPGEVRSFSEFDLKCRECYKGVGEVLAHYTSGHIPKAFKILPCLKNWEEMLALTDPGRWTPAAHYQATRIFVSRMNAKLSQQFLNAVLLEAVRADIADHKKLNFHLYLALKKSLFRPQAFYKGIVLPLCEGGDCTLREATIIASVITRSSIPVLHSAAAMMRIAQLPYNGANSVFLKILLNKKYSLPERVVEEMCAHFLGFMSESRALPVLWHQTLLVFVQRYRADISPGMKEEFRKLLKIQNHYLVTPEIRRELFGRVRDEGAMET